MLIGGVSPLNSPGTSFHPVLTDKFAPAGQSAITALPPLSGSSTNSSASVASAAAPTKVARFSSAAHPVSQQTAASSALAAEELVSGYSTTVGKEKYSASLDLGSGEYTASIANLVGATATATTAQAAENDLGLRIDTLV